MKKLLVEVSPVPSRIAESAEINKDFNHLKFTLEQYSKDDDYDYDQFWIEASYDLEDDFDGNPKFSNNESLGTLLGYAIIKLYPLSEFDKYESRIEEKEYGFIECIEISKSVFDAEVLVKIQQAADSLFWKRSIEFNMNMITFYHPNM